jgi:MFS family permease
MIPFVLGIMAGSIVAGQAIARTGRYRWFPIIGSSLMVTALALFATIGADTPLWHTMLIMALMGLGLGGNMQPMITAVQNAVSPREIGVATSAVTFFRSMGGTLGTAVFLSVLFNVLPGKITNAFQAAHLPAPTQLQGGGDLNDTSFVQKLPGPVAHAFKVGFSDAISVVFLLALAVMLIGLIVVLFLPEIPLAQQSAQQQRAEDAAAEAAADAAPSPLAPPVSAGATGGDGGGPPSRA